MYYVGFWKNPVIISLSDISGEALRSHFLKCNALFFIN